MCTALNSAKRMVSVCCRQPEKRICLGFVFSHYYDVLVPTIIAEGNAYTFDVVDEAAEELLSHEIDQLGYNKSKDKFFKRRNSI